MQSMRKKEMSVDIEAVSHSKRTLMTVFSETVKMGIVKSNTLAMVAGLTLALYVYDINPLNKMLEIVCAIVGSFLIIGAAGAFNNLYDRDIDSIMERTKGRPTVVGEIPLKVVLWLGISMTILGGASLAIASPMASFLGLLGLFLYIFPYTMWTKRRTVYNTEVGSISGAMPPLIGWAAIHPDIMHPAVLGLFVTMVIWQMPHFYAIAIRKHDDYKAANVPMLPVVKGTKRTYMQTNVYLFALVLSSFLFQSVSIVLTVIALVLNMAWFILSIYGYRKMGAEKWANVMFVFSIIHLTVLLVVVIAFSLIGVFFF
ncbi:heme o synthase [Bacillus manliponensis]|uniref:heme o synthase n=1 Tax=Bacillus manliponensis TaxID=574376 RepID=UPI0035113FA1